MILPVHTHKIIFTASKERKATLQFFFPFIQFYIVLKFKIKIIIYKYYFLYHLLLDYHTFMDTDNIVLKTGAIGNSKSK